jgi:uncharacterized protein YqgC (DUF456 family)
MLVGLVCTFLPRIPGTLIIIGGAILYGIVTGITIMQPLVAELLLTLILLAEIGGRLLRFYLTRHLLVSRLFSVDMTVGNLGGIIVLDAILEPLSGILIWELFVGKTLLPRWDSVSKVLLRLAYIAGFRFTCGLIMIIIILFNYM